MSEPLPVKPGRTRPSVSPFACSSGENQGRRTFGRGEEFGNVRDAETIAEPFPDVRAAAVTVSQPDVVVFVVWRGRNRQEVPKNCKYPIINTQHRAKRVPVITGSSAGQRGQGGLPSPTYWTTLAFVARTSRQNVVAENLRPMMTAEREFHDVAMARTDAVEWYCPKIRGPCQRQRVVRFWRETWMPQRFADSRVASACRSASQVQSGSWSSRPGIAITPRQ